MRQESPVYRCNVDLIFEVRRALQYPADGKALNVTDKFRCLALAKYFLTSGKAFSELLGMASVVRRESKHISGGIAVQGQTVRTGSENKKQNSARKQLTDKFVAIEDQRLQVL